MVTETAHDQGGLWKTTKLWKGIRERNDGLKEKVETLLAGWLPGIEQILAKGGTAATDFTLHDEGHARRVAERMVETIPEDVWPHLNSVELGLLLLAAYLHDIGMTPEMGRVRRLHTYLLTGETPDGLSKAERDAFQEWLDNHERGLVPPLCQAAPTAPELGRAAQIITHYSRARHNEWSAEWIRQHTEHRKNSLYTGWVEDLVCLCRSHHQGEEELVKAAFDPRLIPGTTTIYVNPRYLAAVLRIADLLECDPERTPAVLLRHRDIAQESLLYWQKDHQVAIRIAQEQVALQATPTSAHAHRAVLEMVAQIKEELELVGNLARRRPFEVGPIPGQKLPHRWALTLAPVAISPQESDGQPLYTYIDGAFRPDTGRLLELLSGTALYGDPLAAVRELLQNAFDAVGEQLAHQRLSKPNPLDEQVVAALRKIAEVTLTLEADAEGARLICTDTGVGMSKAVIEHDLLASGRAKRHAAFDLERRCEKAGFELERTGQFGIGALSYFMLASHVEFKSRRSPEAGGNEAHGWQFAISSIDDFGALRRHEMTRAGTTVTLQLKPELLAGGAGAWFQRLQAYVRKTLLHLPCTFTLKRQISGMEELTHTYGPGWQMRPEEMVEETVNELLTYDWDESTKRELRQSISWDQPLVLEGRLPDNLGRYRAVIPLFQLPTASQTARALGLMRVQEEGGRLMVSKMGDFKGIEMWAYVPEGRMQMSWRGMAAGSGRIYVHRLAQVVIDWHASAAVELAVSRNRLELKPPAKKAMAWLEQEIAAALRRFCAAQDSSPYALLNYAIAEITPAHRDGACCWLTESVDAAGRTLWGEVAFPAVDSHMPPFEAAGQKLLWQGQPVTRLPALGYWFGRDDGVATGFYRVGGASRVVAGVDGGCPVVPLWTARPHGGASDTPLPRRAFPPAWRALCGATFGYSSDEAACYWNAEHPLVQAVDAAAWAWAKEVFDSKRRNAAECGGEMKGSRARCAAWLLCCFLHDIWHEFWHSQIKQRRPLLEEIWRTAFGQKPQESDRMCFYRYGSLHIMSLDGWEKVGDEDGKALRRYLPDPGAEWRLEVATS